MKNFIALFILTVFTVSAQKPQGNQILFTLGTEYNEAEVTFFDGHKEKGFIYGFISNKWIEFGNPLTAGFETLENKLNLMDNSFNFKNSLDGPSRKLTQKDINEVELLRKNGEVQDYKLMDLETVNVKGEIIDLKKRAWLPFYKKDKINIFSYDVMTSNNGSKSVYAFTVVYLNNPKNNFAINPIDFNRINIFNIGKINDKLIYVLKEVFKDCPEYEKKLDGDSKEILSNYFKNSEERKKDRRDLKENSKDLSKDDRKKLAIELKEKVWIDPYLKLIDDYKKSCPN